jgi:hypothetical protein
MLFARLALVVGLFLISVSPVRADGALSRYARHIGEGPLARVSLAQDTEYSFAVRRAYVREAVVLYRAWHNWAEPTLTLDQAEAVVYGCVIAMVSHAHVRHAETTHGYVVSVCVIQLGTL